MAIKNLSFLSPLPPFSSGSPNSAPSCTCAFLSDVGEKKVIPPYSFVFVGGRWRAFSDGFLFRTPVKQILELSLFDGFSSDDGSSAGSLVLPSFHFDPAQLGVTGSAVPSVQCSSTGLVLPSVGTVTVGASLGQKSLAIEAGSYLATSALPFVFPTGEFTMFAVMRVRSVNLYDGVLCFAADNEQDFSTANGFTLEKADTTNALRCTHRAGNMFERTISYPFNEWSVFTWHRSFAVGSHDVYVRMTKIHSDAFSGNAAINPSRFAIHARVNSGNTFGAAGSALDLADLLIYNKDIGLPAIVEMQNTLCNKYGI